ncbi:MAG TPA: DUF1801 domain-containing protein [Candidatus Saccharimonadales bacterium]|jgi:uncharacterized protein YdhG (YjbR/CyaY superfamily)|nr:DUF1801 domain-containing protein [Candidatus Saccharimonadales bacterium]
MSLIDDYVQKFEPPIRNELERIRSIAKSLLPDCEETISYGMPTIKYRDKSIIGFDAHKNHIGIYPFSGHVISEIEELKNYKTTKGAIQENLGQPLPDSLIEKIIRERVRQAL